jgi:hypothetical protein
MLNRAVTFLFSFLEVQFKTLITICSIKRKENVFSLGFFRVRKRAVLSRVPGGGGGA